MASRRLSFCISSVSVRVIAFVLGCAFSLTLGGLPARADIEIRRFLAAPGETRILVPAHHGLRRVVVDLVLPPLARVSALATWTPMDQSLSLDLTGPGRVTTLVQTSGQSPVVFGTAADTAGGPHRFRIEDARGGGDTLLLTFQVNWSVPRVEAPRLATPRLEAPRDGSPRDGSPRDGSARDGSARVEPSRADPSRTDGPRTGSTMTGTPEPGANRSTQPAPTDASAVSSADPASTLYAAPVRLVELNWREGGTLRIVSAQRDGLRMRWSSPVNAELARDAVRLEVALPGSQEGLWRWEEVILDVKVEGSLLIARLPAKLVLSRETPARLIVDGDRLLSRTGSLVDAEGTGLKLPSGDGRPGGTFRSLLRLIP